MDAAEADADVKLYKASSELLLELQAKVPRLVKDGRYRDGFRKWVISSKVYEVVLLLDAFQEWPQLLDPHLTSLVQVLADAYLWYCVHHPHEYLRKHHFGSRLSPLSRAVSLVLYSFCKVRGRKVIARLLNNEPKYVEPLLACFQLWSTAATSTSQSGTSFLTWEERYIHMLWLSHLMLAPFELSTISGFLFNASQDENLAVTHPDMPNVARSLAMVGFDHLYGSSKSREAATILLVRLSLRSDMLKLRMSEQLVQWTIVQLQNSGESQSHSPGYRFIGLLDLLFGVTNSASDSEAAPFVGSVFHIAHLIMTSEEEHHMAIRDSAPARKSLIKIMRSAVVHAMANDTGNRSVRANVDVNTMLEDCIQVLLDLLADKDTPVRQAASKALSLICLRLDTDMSSEVVEATVESLNENVLLEDVRDGRLFAITDVTKRESTNYKKNLDAVDPLKWHGCMLTLGHLLFRRSLAPSQLQSVLEALLMGLSFEQRSNVGTSVGVGVRDAACFGIWSLARKYSTRELNQTPLSEILLPHPSSFSGTDHVSTLQLIAIHLTLAACLDPSGNLRRGSSAALQELIGRHPDVIAAGIPVVQIIDYHAVARRSRAVNEVAIATSKLSGYYHGSLLYALLGWRGARATDAESRRLAADAAGSLVTMASAADTLEFSRELVSQLLQLKLANSGTSAAARHGLLCMLATLINRLVQNDAMAMAAELFKILQTIIQDMTVAVGTIDGRTTIDLENVLEGTSKLVLELACAISQSIEEGVDLVPPADLKAWISVALSVLEHCTVSTDKAFVTDVAAQGNAAVLHLLDADTQEVIVSSWLDEKQQNKTKFTCRGRIATLARLFEAYQSMPALQHLNHRIFMYLSSIFTSSYTIETKVNAMQGITAIVRARPDLQGNEVELLMTVVQRGLTDYTVDQRGDIGSLLRLQSIEAVKELDSTGTSPQQTQQILSYIVQLAAEKLVKVRFQAWLCLRDHLSKNDEMRLNFDHQADVSSFEYFRNLLVLLQQTQYRDSLLVGLVSCVAGGTEEVSRVAGQALVGYMQGQPTALQQTIIASVAQRIAKNAARAQHVDDREIVPVVDFVSFITEHVVAPQPDVADSAELAGIWHSCQTVHASATTIARTEAMVRLYSAFTMISMYRAQALDKLTRFLLHRWPKIRGAAADAIVLRTSTQTITLCDWNVPAANNKPTVVQVRKELNVAGVTASKG